jgi:putative DNA primase/helicase
MIAPNSTGARVLTYLQQYDITPEGKNKWRSNSPLRPGSNSHAFTVLLHDDGEHGAYFDFVSYDKGSLYELAKLIGVDRSKSQPATSDSKCTYASLGEYAASHGIPVDVLHRAGWRETTRQGRRAFSYPTDSGIKYRFADGNDPKYKPHDEGYAACWYKLADAVALTTEHAHPLVICNGEVSTLVAQHYGVAATAHTGGESRNPPPALLAVLAEHYPAPGPIILASDCDKTGRAGAAKWIVALRSMGYDVQAVDLLGWDKFDLADFCRLHDRAAASTLQTLPQLTDSAPAQQTTITDAPTTNNVQPLTAYNLTDAGNAECFAVLHGDQFRYNRTTKHWVWWNGTRWQGDTDGKVHRAALDVARQRQPAAPTITDIDQRRKAFLWGLSSESSAKLAALLNVAEFLEQFSTTVEKYDTDPFLATVDNGAIDLRTGTRRDACRDDYMTMQLGTRYDAAATCPRWEQFLREVFAGDQELISYIQRAVGYSLTGDTREQKMFLLHGNGANGKSVFLDILSLLVGDYAANTTFDTFDGGRRNEATNDLAALKGKRLVTVIETEEDRRLAEAKVKAVTGQDAITCRFLYGEFFTYVPQFKIWMAMNHKPTIYGTDRGIWRRVNLIPFTQTFEGREDYQLANKLRAELPGILNWALDGLRAWLANGLGTAAAVKRATKQYQDESDVIGQWAAECLIHDADAALLTADALESFKLWCEQNGFSTKRANAILLGRRMAELGYQSEANLPGLRGKRAYAGLRLATQYEQGNFVTDVTDASSFTGNPREEKIQAGLSEKSQISVTSVTPDHDPIEHLPNVPQGPTLTPKAKGDADALNAERFTKLLVHGDVKEAARIAAQLHDATLKQRCATELCKELHTHEQETTRL